MPARARCAGLGAASEDGLAGEGADVVVPADVFGVLAVEVPAGADVAGADVAGADGEVDDVGPAEVHADTAAIAAQDAAPSTVRHVRNMRAWSRIAAENRRGAPATTRDRRRRR
jgi:hypothetical protein